MPARIAGEPEGQPVGETCGSAVSVGRCHKHNIDHVDRVTSGASGEAPNEGQPYGM